jgi:rSAM/selenodomain-associated transferase 2
MKISIIMPVLNEGDRLRGAINALRHLRVNGHEVIVVDGGSADDTPAIADAHADMALSSPRGRALQMNTGARAASGDILLFLHADTLLPPGADHLVIDGLRQSGRGWGRFDVRLAGRHPLLRIIGLAMNWRSRLTGIMTGDQAIFVRRDWFERIGGYPEIALMEDIALSKRLKREGPPLSLRQKVLTSSRRWREQGIVRTIVTMWRLRLAYFLGADPERLARRYYRR